MYDSIIADVQEKLTDEQRQLLLVAADSFWELDGEVAVGWVLWKLKTDHNLSWSWRDFAAAVSTMPVVDRTLTAGVIPLIHVDQPGSYQSVVRAKFLGIAVTQTHEKFVEFYARTIGELAARVSSIEPTLSGSIEAVLTGDELTAKANGFRFTDDVQRAARSAARLMSVNGHLGPSRNDFSDMSVWNANLSLSLLDFIGVAFPHDYLGVLCRRTPYVAPTRSRSISAYELCSALDHLNAVWRLACPAMDFPKAPLYKFDSSETIVKLTLEPQTMSDFESLLSALSQILKFIAPPKLSSKPGPAGSRVSAYLSEKKCFDIGSLLRCTQAFEILDAVGAIRNGNQHSEALGIAHTAAKKLGIALPVSDPKTVWFSIRWAVFEALTTLREELLPLGVGDPAPLPT
jgi:hypothetical protein